jgi:toxin YoeB
MGKYNVEIEKLAKSHIQKHFKSGNKAIIKKIKIMLIELSETPFEGEGKPEELKYELSGYWSRRINLEHRLIYKVDNNTVTVLIISAMGHY